MLWNLEIRSGHEGETLVGNFEEVELEERRFYMHAGRDREGGYFARNEQAGMIERIGFSLTAEGEGISVTPAGLVIKGLEVFSVPDKGSKVEQFIHATGVGGGELHADWEGDIPQLHRQWTLRPVDGMSLAIPALAHIEAEAEGEPELALAGAGTA